MVVNPATLDPQKTPSAQTLECASATQSRLFRFKPVKDLAQGYYDVTDDLAVSSESPDALIWTVKLRPGVKFHDVAPVSGRAFGPEDVKTSFERALSPLSPNRASLGMIDAIETPASDTVVFRLKYAYAEFPNTLANGQYSWILPREVASDGYDPAKQLIGTGPFVFDSYTPDVAVTLKRNPGWFRGPGPYVDSVRFAVIPDAAAALAQFTAGTLGSLLIQQQDLDTAKKSSPNAQVLREWAGGGPITYFQMGDPASPFQDIRVRRAVSLAVDRASMSQVIWNNQSEASFNVERPMGEWALKMTDLDAGSAQWYKFDLKQATDLIKAAGLENQAFKLVYPSPPPVGPYYVTIAEMVHSMLSRLPWQLSISPIDFNKDYIGGGKGARYGNYPSNTLVSTALQASTTVDDYIFKNFQSDSTSSASRVHDGDIDAMLAKERAITDDGARLKAALDLQRYIADRLYTLAGLPQGYVPRLVAAKVRNYMTGDTYSLGDVTWANVWLAAP